MNISIQALDPIQCVLDRRVTAFQQDNRARISNYVINAYFTVDFFNWFIDTKIYVP